MWRWRWRRNTCVVFLLARGVWVTTVIRFTYSINIVLSSILTYKRGNADSSLFLPYRFMIMCEQQGPTCHIWYHGPCVKISKAKAKKIQKFICFRCKYTVSWHLYMHWEKRSLLFQINAIYIIRIQISLWHCKKVALCCFKICLDT